MLKETPVEAYFARYIDIIVAPYYYNLWTDFFGNGLGSPQELVLHLGGGYGGAENAWSRPIIENGVNHWIFFISLENLDCQRFTLFALNSIKRRKLPCYFLIWSSWAQSYSLVLLGQPTNLGFAAFGSGFVLPQQFQKK